MAIGFVIAITITDAKSEQSLELNKAIEAWLDYDDETALPLLSSLAKSGNENAMLLLGQINIRSSDFSPYLKSLDIKSRNALIRAKGGFSGKSWFNFVVKQKELARVLTDVNHSNKRLKATDQLLSIGEIGLAANSFYSLLNQTFYYNLFPTLYKHMPPAAYRHQFYGMAVFSDNTTLNEEARIQKTMLLGLLDRDYKKGSFQSYLFFGLAGKHIRQKGNFRKEISVGTLLAVGGSKFYRYEDDTQGDNKQLVKNAIEIIFSAEEPQPLVDFCNKTCPGAPRTCMRYVYGSIGGYAGYTGIQSPLEKLIPSKKFFSSKRFEAELLDKVDDAGWSKIKPFNTPICSI
ncbi:MAG: hypothetical protein GY761_09405 [Hyphomicrobiales bacterium]|nr:hypothetical protein [Hyphomicrobiales bacterium]